MNRRLIAPALLVLLTSGCPSKDTAKPREDLHRFDAVHALPEVRAFAGPDAQLTDIYGRGVRSDGTIDAYAKYRPTVHYEFIRTAPVDESVPIGASGHGTGYESARVTVMKPGMTYVTGGNDYRRLGMERDIHPARKEDLEDVVEDPKCSFGQLWKSAIDAGVTPEAVADFHYENNTFHGLGYELDIRDLDVRMRFDADCNVVDSHVPGRTAP